MKTVIILFLVIGWISAQPADFIRVPNEFRHGTYDRTWQKQVAYHDKDGSIYLPVGSDLTKTDIKTFTALIKTLEAGVAVLDYHVFVHPDAHWKDIQGTIALFADSKMKFNWRIAKLKAKATQ